MKFHEDSRLGFMDRDKVEDRLIHHAGSIEEFKRTKI